MIDVPPRLAVRLLVLRLPAEWRDFVLGDLEEEFRTRAAASPASARRWFWRQTIRCLAAPPRDRAFTVSSVDPPGDSFMRTLVADIRYAVRTSAPRAT
ncbi:MAG TPA: permease prefix domain 2-containing transporter [Vicinamibacterales bacterium]|nr:permease prefix domain 2-containing transporter [Vicinamibacterales bacterium]